MVSFSFFFLFTCFSVFFCSKGKMRPLMLKKKKPSYSFLFKYSCFAGILVVLLGVMLPLFLLLQCSSCFGSFSPQATELTKNTLLRCEPLISVPLDRPQDLQKQIPGLKNADSIVEEGRGWSKDQFVVSSSHQIGFFSFYRL